MMTTVFHGSRTRKLKEIVPKLGSHGKEWVYATKDLAVAAIYMSNFHGGDFYLFQARDMKTGIFTICERCKNAFHDLYTGSSGSIYVLPGKTFKEGLTGYFEEVVSDVPVCPLEEIEIEDVEGFLTKLNQENKLCQFYYPDKCQGIPLDDEDLVFRAVIWSKKHGQKILDRFKVLHPKLYPGAVDILNNHDKLLHSIYSWIKRSENQESGFIDKKYFLEFVDKFYPQLSPVVREKIGHY